MELLVLSKAICLLEQLRKTQSNEAEQLEDINGKTEKAQAVFEGEEKQKTSVPGMNILRHAVLDY